MGGIPPPLCMNRLERLVSTMDEEHNQALFLTPVTKKTKTQAQNSRKKLKEKTQPQEGTFLLLKKKHSRENSFLSIIPQN